MRAGAGAGDSPALTITPALTIGGICKKATE
jgi:hypothetical protein